MEAGPGIFIHLENISKSKGVGVLRLRVQPWTLPAPWSTALGWTH